MAVFDAVAALWMTNDVDAYVAGVVGVGDVPVGPWIHWLETSRENL